MAISKTDRSLSTSFMFLSFATAALIMGVQTSGLFVDRATASSSASSPTSPSPARSDASIASVSTSTAPEPVQIGIDKIVSSSLHPVVLIQQPQILVDLSDRRVSLYQNGLLQVSYEIAVGRAGWETPSGNFQILSMQEHPVWQNPITGEMITNSPDNPLGSRWIGFWTDGTHQVGFHGTNQDELIGQAVSHGCIRMRDREIQALYSQVAVGTPVMVQP